MTRTLSHRMLPLVALAVVAAGLAFLAGSALRATPDACVEAIAPLAGVAVSSERACPTLSAPGPSLRGLPHDADSQALRRALVPAPSSPLESPRPRSAEAAIQALAEASDDLTRLEALRELWIVAADSGVPQAALDALEGARHDAAWGSELEREAERALDDLARLRGHALLEAEWQNSDSGLVEPRDWSDDPFALLEPLEASELQLEDFAELASDLEAQLYDPDPVTRTQAVHQLTRFRRAESSQMLVIAAEDPDPEVRSEALRGLWLSAADGVDPDGATRDALEYASTDPSRQVRALALRAIHDLERLAETH